MKDDETKRREYARLWENDRLAQHARRGANDHRSDPWSSVREFHREDNLMWWAIAAAGFILLIFIGGNML